MKLKFTQPHMECMTDHHHHPDSHHRHHQHKSFGTKWLTGKQPGLSIPVGPVAEIRKMRIDQPGR